MTQDGNLTYLNTSDVSLRRCLDQMSDYFIGVTLGNLVSRQGVHPSADGVEGALRVNFRVFAKLRREVANTVSPGRQGGDLGVGTRVHLKVKDVRQDETLEVLALDEVGHLLNIVRFSIDQEHCYFVVVFLQLCCDLFS